MLAHASLYCDEFICQERSSVLAQREAESSRELGLGSLVPSTAGM